MPPTWGVSSMHGRAVRNQPRGGMHAGEGRKMYRLGSIATGGVCLVLAAGLLSGCPLPTFQALFKNTGDYPVVGVFMEEGTVSNEAVNLLSVAVPAGGEVVL